MSDKETISNKEGDVKFKYTGDVLGDAANRLLTDEKLMKKIGHEVTLFTRDVLSDETVQDSRLSADWVLAEDERVHLYSN
ncbi:hypothetical protein C5167_027069 [Papaver somniferum]|nr:hypothetical protein C5167_027069 [Papaver somniferum]